VKRGNGVRLQKITICFSTPFSGSFILELHERIYLQVMEPGKIFIDVFVAGGTKASGIRH